MQTLPRLAVAALVATGLAIAPTAADARSKAHGGKGDRSDLVQVLERSGSFGTLLALLDATDLTDTIATGGPFTIFAPTDDAFAKLPQETVDFLLANPDVLTQVLLYHVADGRQRAQDLLRAGTPETLLGQPVLVTAEKPRVLVNRSTVLKANVFASNGIVHAIDTVLTPPEEPIEIASIIDVLRLDGRFGTLLAALGATGLDAALAGPGPLTLFAPTDDAFAALGQETIDALLADPAALSQILLYHVAGEELTARQLKERRSVETLQGDTVDVRSRRGVLRIDQARVLTPNVGAPNGIVHAIDGVLLPGE